MRPRLNNQHPAVLDLDALALHIDRFSMKAARDLDAELVRAFAERPSSPNVTIVGRAGVGEPEPGQSPYGFYKLFIKTPARWWRIEGGISRAMDPLPGILRVGEGAAAHVLGGITNVLARPVASNRHLHPAIGEVLRQLDAAVKSRQVFAPPGA